MLPFFRRKQKFFFAFIIVVQMFVTATLPVQAGLFGGPSIPSTSGVVSDIQKQFHLDTGSLQSQGENFNVADNKKLTPEVSLFFNPNDPRPGEKLSVKAFPMYFSNSENALYYTWYLKRTECSLTEAPSALQRTLCDRDGDGHIRVNDWKIEAAQILVQNGYTPVAAPDSDDDGYKARYGGDNKVNTPDHCYVNDSTTGRNYELGDAGDTNFTCPAGTSPVCMVGEGQINAENIDVPGSDPLNPTSGTSGPAFSFADTDVCYVSGIPACTGGTPLCNVGSPRCVANPTTATSCGTALNACSADSSNTVKSYCEHLFPEMPGFTSGDGSFGGREEAAWGTDPSDPDTADNGNKDEANIVGLGQSTFTWNYSSGDQVGVAVEGTSMLTTKHDDSSSMIMWAFSKKNCPITLAKGTGSYFKNIKGYQVEIPTADFDLNKCLERNLVDPTQGGQSTNLEVTMSATPDTPLNDETADKGGDLVAVQAIVPNALNSIADILFEWNVEISNNVQFRTGAGLFTADITNDLRTRNLLGNTKGISLDSLRLKLDLPNSGADLFGGRPLSRYLLGGIGYIRFTTKASENFASGIVRKGKSDVIVKFTSSGKKITAYKADPVLVGTAMHVALPGGGGPICNVDPIDRAACRVIKNEIIGLKVDSAGLSNFQWVINGTPLVCSKAGVSPNCQDGEQNNVNFFPVSGNPGDSYTVTMTANDVTTSETVTLSRTFHVIEPGLFIDSLDPNMAWPKFLGQYTDVTGSATDCIGGVCNNFSDIVFQAFSDDTVGFKAVFLPSFVGSAAERQWSIDGENVDESGVGEISFIASKPALDMYNIKLEAVVVQSEATRRALLDVWGISQLDSPEIRLSSSNQLELQEPGFTKGPLQGPRKYLAAIASYIPTSIMFSFRILLSVALILFTTGFLFSLIPERGDQRSLGLASRKYPSRE